MKKGGSIDPDAQKTVLLKELDLLHERLTRKAESSLETFVTLAWPVIEPHTPFVGGWHIGAMCQHLEAVLAGELRQLLILVPPRMTKSTVVSVCLLPWAWIRRPGLRMLFASYAAKLSLEHAVVSRRLIDSPWYQQRWAQVYQLTTDQNVKAYYENTQRGYRMSTSTDAGATGHGADILVLDDPHNLSTVYSEAERQAVLDFYKRSWHNRLNDPGHGSRVCIMQRAHPNDLASELMALGYETLQLPNEYDPARSRATSLGWRDPRTMAGELLCPARLGAEETASLRRFAGDYSSQYQQEPLPETGRLFERSWFRVLSAVPLDVVAWVRFWDVAGTAGGTGARTAGVKMGRTASGRYVIVDIVTGRWTEQGVNEAVSQAAALDGIGCAIREEQEPGSSGLAVIRARARALVGYDYRGVPATGDKVTRARPLRAQAEAGNVDLVARTSEQAEQVRDFLNEMESFPHGLKDQCDASSGALAYLTGTDRGEMGLLFAGSTTEDDVSDLEAEVARLQTELGLGS